METAICKTSTEKIQDEGLNMDLKTEGLSLSDSSFSSASASSLSAENSELNMKGKANLSMSGLLKVDSEKSTSCESPKIFESPQKSLSPTLIEHAIKVMKNLFSPDKTRSESRGKPTNIPSPILHRSASNSPVNSVYIPAEFCTSESGIEIKNIVQSAENSLKGDLSLGVMHNSFGLDPLNSTKDSFFSAVSPNDESFQSAFTNLDENVMENLLNDSRGLDLLPLRESLGNNSMENMTLVNDSLSSDRSRILGDVLNGNSESQESVQDNRNNIDDGYQMVINGLSKSTVDVFKYGERNENPSTESFQPSLTSGEEEGEREIIEKEEVGREIIEKEEVGREIIEKEEILMVNFNEFDEPSQNMKNEETSEFVVENLPSCETLESSESLYNGLEEGKKEDSDENEMIIREEVIEIDGIDDVSEVLIIDRSVEKSISTTTVILNAMDSVDIDNMLLSLKEDDSGTNTSSLNSLEGNEENGGSSSDHGIDRQFDLPSTDEASTFSNGDVHGRSESSFDGDFISKKPSGRITSKSEENSPTKLNSARKNKLNKSIDFVKRRSRSKSPKGKKPQKLGSRSSGGISMIISSELSENISAFHYPSDVLKIESNPEVQTILSPQSLNVETNTIGKNVNQCEKSAATLDESDAVSVVSQQSYTILSTHNKNLNRPVINSFENLNGKPNLDQISNATYSIVPAVIGESKAGGPENVYSSVSSETLTLTPTSKPSTLTYQVKSNSKLSKNQQNGSEQTFDDLGSLNFLSQEEPGGKDNGGDFNDVRDSSVQTKLEPKEESPELSPVATLGNRMFFSNEKNLEKKVKCSTPNKPNQKNLESPAANNLNQTYEKKAESPAMNQTFDKQEPSVQNVFNQTYEKNFEGFPPDRASQGEPESPAPNQLNQTYEKKVESPAPNKMNQTYDKKHETSGQNVLSQTYEKKAESPAPNFPMNQTFDKKQDPSVQNVFNQTYEKKSEGFASNKVSQGNPESPAPLKFNETFDQKRPESPIPNQLDQTYEKKKESPAPNKMNQTFDTKQEPLVQNTANRTYEKTPEGFGGKPESPAPQKFNETFDKKPESPSALSQTFEIPEARAQDETNKTFEIKSSSRGGDLSGETFEKDKILGGTNEPSLLSRISEEIAQSVSVQSPRTSLAAIAESFEAKTTEEFDGIKDALDVSFISTSSNASFSGDANSTVLFNQAAGGIPAIEDLTAKVQEMKLTETVKKGMETEKWCVLPSQGKKDEQLSKDQTIFSDYKSLPAIKEEKLQCDSELAQLIQGQFSSADIEKICSVVDDMSFLRLSSQKANEQFESLSDFKPLGIEFKSAALTPQGFDFLSSIKGKPTGRDFSRESLYLKFDPLVQALNANSLIDFTKEAVPAAAAAASPETEAGGSVCEQLLAISPEKKPEDIVPPLTPLSHKKNEDSKTERLNQLQNEIYFFRNMYAEREKLNKAKMDEFESQVAKLTGENCMLEDKLKESNEREKSLVKKLKEVTQNVNQLKTVMEEYVKMITKLTVELQELKRENAKQVETLISEKDSYITHLQNTEAAFTDVHAKYEKSKKTILNLKANEAAYKTTIDEKTRLLENLREKAKEAQEVALKEFQKIQEELNDAKVVHRQETTRLRAQLRKMELKQEAMQESIDHKTKENEQLTAIFDELIEGKN